MTHAEWLDLVIDRAPQLRSAGVHAIAFDGATVTLYEERLAVGDDPAGQTPEAPLNALDDPSMFPGGILPGYDLPASNPRPAEGDA